MEPEPPEDRLSHTLRTLQRGKAARTSPSPELAAYLRYVAGEQVGYIRVLSAGAGRTDVPLSRVYADVKVDLSLSINIVNNLVADAWLDTPRAHAADPAGLRAVVSLVQEMIDRGLDQSYPDLAERPLVLAPPWSDRRRDSFWRLDALDAASLFPRLVVLGPPGGGKSTFAKALALLLITHYGRHEGDHAANALTKRSWAHGALAPVVIELRRLVEWPGFPKLGEPATEGLLWDYVRDRLNRANLGHVCDALRTELLQGRGCVLFDGIDEVPVPPGRDSFEMRREQIHHLARSVAAVYGGSRIVFTARSYAYRDWELPDFAQVTLQPLDRRAAVQLIRNLASQRGLSTKDANDEVEGLLQALEEVPTAIKDYPLFLSLMAALYWQGDERALPSTKASLYRESIDLLLNRWAEDDRDEAPLTEQLGCDAHALFTRLERIAYQTHSAGERDRTKGITIDFPILVTELFRLGDDVNSHSVLAYLTERAGVLVAQERETFTFAHRGYQEYLAASYLSKEVDASLNEDEEDVFVLVRRLMRDGPLHWREPLVLLGDLVRSGRRPNDIWALMAGLLARPEGTQDETDGWAWCAWLCGRYVLEHHLDEAVPSRARGTVNLLRSELTQLIERERLSVAERIEAATALGILGDPRPGIGICGGLPDIAWCEIPEGTFRMGTDANDMAAISEQPWAAGWGFAREMPSSAVWLPAYSISRFPVTRAQFAAFMADPEGYKNDEWWTGVAAEWRGAAKPSVASGSNLPQTYVSWFEAQAFCRWLSCKSDANVRLPSEAEWERAARSPDGRIFPWGNKFSVDCCNTKVSGIGHIVPVGIYGSTTSAKGGGPQDMSGNVWEWCMTVAEGPDGGAYTYPYVADDGRETPELLPACRRVVRGGSYVNPPFLARTAYRGRDRPTGGLGRTGFRVVMSG